MGSAARDVVDNGKRVQLTAQSPGFMRGVSGSCGLALPNDEEHCFSQYSFNYFCMGLVIFMQFWWTELQPLWLVLFMLQL